MGEHLLDLVFGKTLVLGEEIDLGPIEVDWCVRCEFEGVIRDVDLVAAWERGEGGLELAFPDVAPRAGDIGPVSTHEVYRNICHHTRP
jgi:hypothetical protein